MSRLSRLFLEASSAEELVHRVNDHVSAAQKNDRYTNKKKKWHSRLLSFNRGDNVLRGSPLHSLHVVIGRDAATQEERPVATTGLPFFFSEVEQKNSHWDGLPHWPRGSWRETQGPHRVSLKSGHVRNDGAERSNAHLI